MTPDQLTDYLITNERRILTAKAFGDADAIAMVHAYKLWSVRPSDYNYLRLLTVTASFRERAERIVRTGAYR